MSISFGKYKGRPIEVLLEDTSYCQWLVEQDWFASKNPELYDKVKQASQDNTQALETSSLASTKNFLLSIALKEEKIEDWTVFPFSLPAVRNLERTHFHPHVTFIVGENGSGKSTLLEALAISQGFNAEGGTTNFHFSTRESHSDLHAYLRIAKDTKKPETGFFLRAESFFNVATEIEKLDQDPLAGNKIIHSYGGKSLHEQSHGEAFFSLMKNRFSQKGLYLLDEPEAALSPKRQIEMLSMMHALVKQGSQFVICTHSPILLAYPNATIYQIEETGLVKRDYTHTETFKITHNFLNHYEELIDEIL
ncbi:MAG: AAA family ATPase [Sulfurovum sp.]|nr:AAA family ATPase [Sulfurovum sp.]